MECYPEQIHEDLLTDWSDHGLQAESRKCLPNGHVDALEHVGKFSCLGVGMGVGVGAEETEIATCAYNKSPNALTRSQLAAVSYPRS